MNSFHQIITFPGNGRLLSGSKLLTQANTENTESVYQGPRRPYGWAGGWKMPSHRKSKRKKDGQRLNTNGTPGAPEAPTPATQERQGNGRAQQKNADKRR